ncbi:MAG: PP2C family protein-serine/threonine phosphatase [Phycisphaerales bacterium]
MLTSGASVGGQGPVAAATARAMSIRDFLTDGSLARMCDELARLTGVPIWLQDNDGQAVIPSPPGERGGQAWRVVDPMTGAARAFGLVHRAYDPSADLFAAPIRTSVGDIGAIIMPADWGRDDPNARRALERALSILAGSAVEAAEGAIALRQKLHELDSLFRLSSLLVKADDPQRVLQTALNLALDVLRMDCGTIAQLDEDGELRHRAMRDLSPEWLANPTPLTIDGHLRERAMAGEIVVVEDLQSDPEIIDQERAKHEGVVTLIGAGLITGGRPLGMIRLYSRARRSFTDKERELLRAIADHAAMALGHAKLRELREADKQMQRQLRVAADVQRRMLPRSLPRFAPFDLAARYAPSYQLGGDFYDLFDRRGQLGVVLGDVVGKGVPAALIMSAVRATLRAHASTDLPLDEVVTRVNRAMVRDTLESEFVTMWTGLIDPQSLVLTYGSAGHDPAMVFSRDGQMVELAAGGMALGIDGDQAYQTSSHQLRPGDVLLAYTDGLPDAADFENRKFGKDRVRETVAALLAAEPGASAQRVVEHIAWTLRQFCGVRLSVDDVTLVVVRVREGDQAARGGSDLAPLEPGNR